MWLINWIPGLLFIRFTDALYTRFVGDTVLQGANPVAKVNSLCSWSSTQAKRRGMEGWDGAMLRPRSKARLTLGDSLPHSAGISPGRPVLKRFSLLSCAWRGVLFWGCFSKGTERCRQTPRVTPVPTQGSAELECGRLGATPVKL